MSTVKGVFEPNFLCRKKSKTYKIKLNILKPLKYQRLPAILEPFSYLY